MMISVLVDLRLVDPDMELERLDVSGGEGELYDHDEDNDDSINGEASYVTSTGSLLSTCCRDVTMSRLGMMSTQHEPSTLVHPDL
jgi:hypothetical protein